MTNQATLPTNPGTTPHRVTVTRQPNPDIPDRPRKATSTNCGWTWHSRWHSMALRMATHHNIKLNAGSHR
jgi:hypothetical protein